MWAGKMAAAGGPSVPAAPRVRHTHASLQLLWVFESAGHAACENKTSMSRFPESTEWASRDLRPQPPFRGSRAAAVLHLPFNEAASCPGVLGQRVLVPSQSLCTTGRCAQDHRGPSRRTARSSAEGVGRAVGQLQGPEADVPLPTDQRPERSCGLRFTECLEPAGVLTVGRGCPP